MARFALTPCFQVSLRCVFAIPGVFAILAEAVFAETVKSQNALDEGKLRGAGAVRNVIYVGIHVIQCVRAGTFGLN